ncbi:hypothetical protein VIBNIPon4_300009 [Vibrio nigripulchritudo POn4]|uniref:Uncharacterized protein n=1 Tax=Vibrio nigripulchritudo SOn1 TaxID=1238450 RepID=A0AAV2VLJ2_9VIBR|nr:hypothetical protein VIBNIPon4_300009 [Vibrio nigripulchritudo POn4]CCN69820.1 hypothetical protein VIBNISFn118_1500008 [Vibrio nigripulchritudo SFn118]CCN93588.1 hypothetical protein VIBNIENn2_240064 [Vibrio nigripulchritudo ENn2]CCO40046.1 hypothetical protein VIBNISFn135_220008 [Vibrio nigripulchritudo SFn135]CCO45349.1 hypothetical protein VIBNISOn1_1440007 [Vibrio nigripulchritudo SOn1]
MSAGFSLFVEHGHPCSFYFSRLSFLTTLNKDTDRKGKPYYTSNASIVYETKVVTLRIFK